MKLPFQQARFVQSYGLKSQLPPSRGAELVFAGRSNVGKSSLINRLCGQRALARVSSTPGKTTTINTFSLGENAVLVDLPGYGYARRSDAEKRRWGDLMEHYFNSGREIRLVLLLLDSRHKPSAEDFDMLGFLQQAGYPFCCVLTKTDKLGSTAYRENLAKFAEWLAPYPVLRTIPFSTSGEEPAAALRAAIEELTREQTC